MVDASVISAFILKEPGWRNLIKYLSKSATVDFAIKEVSNAIWKAYSRGIISLGDARKKFIALKRLLEVNVELFPEEELIGDAFELALLEGVTVYDALYISLAKKRDSILVSFDKKQIEIAERIKVKAILLR